MDRRENLLYDFRSLPDSDEDTSLQTFKMVASFVLNKRDSKNTLPLGRTEHL